jgi:hypothetical protein
MWEIKFCKIMKAEKSCKNYSQMLIIDNGQDHLPFSFLQIRINRWIHKGMESSEFAYESGNAAKTEV